MLRVNDTRRLLDREGYAYIAIEEEPQQPELSQYRFLDIVPELERGPSRAREVAKCYLYKHQLEALRALEEGKNVILIAGTGSGKTESWALYTLRHRARTLAIYPTLALAEDQFDRLKSYVKALGGYEVLKVDASIVDEYNKRFGVRARAKLGEELSRALIVVTNPAFLMADFKRFATRGTSWLSEFIRDVDLIVVDEIDFYGSSRATLLLVLIELIVRFIARKRPRIAVLGATLGNPSDVAKYLTEINGRATVIIRGKAMKVLNRWILIVGKNIATIRDIARKIVNERSDLAVYRPFVEDEELFLRYVHVIVEELRKLGYRVPEPAIEPEKIIAHYVLSDEDGVTLVFTPSIRSAERLAARIKALLPPELHHKVAVHHHLVPKNVRSEIEERLQRGEIKVAISVRTLLQGVDIGIAVRVVHYGLSPDIREIKQREGRKGRRPYIPFTESIVIPISSWDHELLSLGVKGIREFLELSIENVYIHPDNEFVKIFRALSKFLMRASLSNSELEVLKKHKLIRYSKGLVGATYVLSDKGKRVWQYLNFYEFGPPYGYPRYLVEDSRSVLLEPVSRRDVVEKLQPYTFDLSNEAMVQRIDRDGVHEVKLSELYKLASVDPNIDEALRNYNYIKRKWGEDADIVRDILTAKVQSRVSILLDIPSKGFGTLREVPLSVQWVIEGSKRIVVVKHGEIFAYYPKEVVELPAESSVYYEELTYGYIVELPPGIEPADAKLAAAIIRLGFRFSRYRTPFREIAISVVENSRSPVVIMVWEPEPSGLLESVDWREIAETIKKLGTSRLHYILLKAIDDDAALYLISKYGGVWSKPIEVALRVLDAIARTVSGVILSIRPLYPSKQAIAIFMSTLRTGTSTAYAFAAIGDRYSKTAVCESMHELPCGEVIEAFRDVLVHAYSSKTKPIILHYAQGDMLEAVAGEDDTARLLLHQLVEQGLVIDVSTELEKRLGFKPSITELVEEAARIVGSRLCEEISIAKELVRVHRNSDVLNRLAKYSEAIARAIFVIATGRLSIPMSGPKRG